MTGICWHDKPGGCWDRHDHCRLIQYGRCRSGARWFWAATRYDYDSGIHFNLDGTAGTEGEALAAARAAAEQLADGHPAVAELRHGAASGRLKAVNAARRKLRAPSRGTPPGAVEYLYGTRHYVPDYWADPEVRKVIPYRVARRTAKRVYYVRRDYGDGDARLGFIDREALERDGQAVNRGRHWSDADHTLYATREAAEHALGLDRPTTAAVPDLRQLRLDMADAHPDRGGTAEEFAAARKRYERARAAAERAAS